MNTTLIKSVMAVFIMLLAGMFAMTAYAAKNTAPELHVQNFQHDALSVQFRYKDQKLVGLRLMNTGKQPLNVTIYNENYLLGPGDYVKLDPPAVKHLQIYHSLIHREPSTAVENVLKNRFAEHHMYNLPQDANNKTTN